MNIIKSINKHNNNHHENDQKSGNILNSMSCTSRDQFSNMRTCTVITMY